MLLTLKEFKNAVFEPLVAVGIGFASNLAVIGSIHAVLPYQTHGGTLM